MLNNYVLGQSPFMQFTGLDAKFAAYGYMITKDWYTRENKPTFSEPTGTLPLPNPIVFDGLGRTPEIFFATDSPYYLEIHAQDNTLIWQTPEPYIPGIGSGSILDEALDSINLFSNAQFYKYPTASYSPVPSEIADLAMLGWAWRQDGTNTSDTLEFIPFNIDDNSVSPPSVNFLRYTSLLNGVGETYKELYFVFPNVRVLANEQITVAFDVRSQIAGNFQLGVGVIQRFGTGGSSPVTTLFNSVTLNTAFNQLSVTGTVPDLSGKTLGTGPTSLEIIIQYPLNSAQRIDIVNLYLKRGTAVNGYPYVDPYHDLASIYGYNSQVSTGDIKSSFKLLPDIGWILADDGTIGNVGSGATNLADPEAFNLFSFFWNITTDTICPVRFVYSTGTASQSGTTVTGTGTTFTLAMEGGTIIWNSGQTALITTFTDATHLTVSTTATVPNGPYIIKYGDKGLTPISDFLSGKVLYLPKVVDRTLVMTSSTNPVGSSFGSNLLTAANFPTGLTYTDAGHTHIPPNSEQGFVTYQGASFDNPFHDGTYMGEYPTTGIGYANVTGPVGAANAPFRPNSVAVNIFIKL